MMKHNTRIPHSWTSRREVAVSVFPGSKERTAVARLRRWLKDDPTLLAALQKVGYRQGIHYFSPRMRAVMRQYFG